MYTSPPASRLVNDKQYDHLCHVILKLTTFCECLANTFYSLFHHFINEFILTSLEGFQAWKMRKHDFQLTVDPKIPPIGSFFGCVLRPKVLKRPPRTYIYFLAKHTQKLKIDKEAPCSGFLVLNQYIIVFCPSVQNFIEFV